MASFNETISILSDFIEVSIHTILFLRRLYPPDLFRPAKRFNTPVYQSRHPGLLAYIGQVKQGLIKEMKSGRIKSMQLVFADDLRDETLERWIFEWDDLARMSQVDSRSQDQSVEGGMSKTDLELHLRGFLLKILAMDGGLGPLKDVDEGRVSWSVVLETLPDQMPIGNDQDPTEPPWVPATATKTAQNAALVPVKYVDTRVVKLQVMVQVNEST